MKRLFLLMNLMLMGLTPHTGMCSLFEKPTPTEQLKQFAIGLAGAVVTVAVLTTISSYIQQKMMNDFGGNNALPSIPHGEAKKWSGSLPQPFEKILEEQEEAKIFIENNVPLDNGYLLHGVPGTGKTFAIRVLAEKLNVPLIETNSGQFINIWQGSGNQTLKNIIKQARSCRKKLPFRCIVFIDEIDGFMRHRGGIGDGGEDRLFNDILSVITDEKNNDILFIAATNFLHLMDPALIRTGRLVPVELKLPSSCEREQFLTHFCEQKQLSLDTSVLSKNEFAHETEKYSNADLEALCNESFRSHLLYQLHEWETERFKLPFPLRLFVRKGLQKEYPHFSLALKKGIEKKKKDHNADLSEAVQMMYQ